MEGAGAAAAVYTKKRVTGGKRTCVYTCPNVHGVLHYTNLLPIRTMNGTFDLHISCSHDGWVCRGRGMPIESNRAFCGKSLARKRLVAGECPRRHASLEV